MLTDSDKMPFGKHKGKRLSDVPDDYLLWLYDELKVKCSPFAQPLIEYIEDNYEAIKQNLEAKYPKPFFND